MRFSRLVVSVAIMIMGVAQTTQAQNEERRRGFWIGFGLGVGWNTSEGLDQDREIGGAGYLRMGGTVSQNVLLGGETMGWARTVNDVTLARANATFTAMIYPSATDGFYLKAGLGFSSVSRAFTSGNTTVTQSENGFGTTIGLGYDVLLGRVSLTPAADFLIQAFDAGQNLTSTNTMLLFTLGLAWY